MKMDDAKSIRNQLKSIPPPCDLEFFSKIVQLDWNESEDVEIYCDILLWINANIIIYTYDIEERERQLFRIILRKIEDRIESSNFTKFVEFNEYYGKFHEYMSDL